MDDSGGSTTPLAPVVDSLSAYVIAGAVSSLHVDGEHATTSRTPAQGIQDGIDAERIGFRRIWLSERLDIKTADVILSGIAARTSRLEVGSGVIAAGTRNPWLTAALGATMQTCYGPRFVLGLGRGDKGSFRGTEIQVSSYQRTSDYVDIVRRLWAGERVTYDGPAGRFDELRLSETYHGDPPPIWLAGYAFPRGAQLIAEKADGVLLIPMLTPTAVAAAKERIATACERVGRDPGTVRVAALVVTAPDLDHAETRALAHSRMVTYLTYPGNGETLVEVNGWDPAVLDTVRGHELLRGLKDVPDRVFQRHQLLKVADAVPDEYIRECSAIGTVSECVDSLQRFFDAGADEVAVYGSTPAQNAELVTAWRAHTAQRELHV
ncbi:MAG: TIGR03857 family LLM class F420-dependent oxidoreductase [Solirubrobacteraceae bacterium]